MQVWRWNLKTLIMEVKWKNSEKTTRGKNEVSYDSNEGLLYKYGNYLQKSLPLDVSL